MFWVASFTFALRQANLSHGSCYNSVCSSLAAAACHFEQKCVTLGGSIHHE